MTYLRAMSLILTVTLWVMVVTMYAVGRDPVREAVCVAGNVIGTTDTTLQPWPTECVGLQP